MMENRVLWIAIGAIILSVVLLTTVSTVLKQPTPTPLKPTPSPVSLKQPTPKPAYTDLMAVSLKNQAMVDEEVTIEIRIATGGNLVTGVQLEMGYDPSILAVDTISAGDFFAKPIEYANKNDTAKGEIIFALGSFEGKKGDGTIANIRARARKKTNGQIEVLTIKPTTIVTEFDTTNSVLKESKGASLVIR